MSKIDELRKIIDIFHKSTISSEAEVRSKFIVPLIEYLGYPSQLRAEEFPVYGSEGSTQLKTKHADFILFKSSDFANHRNRNEKCLNWVHNNSLLVFEAKNTDAMPDFMGQPKYYTFWARALAYLVTDGKIIKGYYYKDCTSDIEIININIDELIDNKLIELFSYENLLTQKEARIKENHKIVDIIKQTSTLQQDSIIEYEPIVNDNDLDGIPDETFNYMRRALGKDSIGLGKLELISKYLNLTNTLLANDIRYDIPEYMLEIPRKFIDVLVYSDDSIIPSFEAECTQFYRNNIDIYWIHNNYFTLWAHSTNDIIDDIKYAYSIQDDTVDNRLSKIKSINNILNAELINIIAKNHTNKLLSVCIPKSKEKKDIISKTKIDIASLDALKTIEEYYDISFKLTYIDSKDINILFENIQVILDGINNSHNCTYTVPQEAFDSSIDCPLEVSEPVVFQEGADIKLPTITLFNAKFTPSITTVLPGKINVPKNHRKPISINCCCTYKLVTEE